jgi:hypothetical protein
MKASSGTGRRHWRWGFYKGARVEASEKAFQYGVFERRDAPVLGTVTGFGRSSTLINVRRDGRKTPMGYHLDFWKLTKPKGAA